MTDLVPNQTLQWPEVYQLETTDRALGGSSPGQTMNRQAQALVDRFAYLVSQFGTEKVGSIAVGPFAAQQLNTLLPLLFTAARTAVGVDTVAQLKTLPIPTVESPYSGLAFLTGESGAISGMYMWNGSSTATPDDRYVVQRTGTPTGRWLLSETALLRNAVLEGIAVLQGQGAERMRMVGDLSFLSFYNTGNTTRRGFIRTQTDGVEIGADAVNNVSITTNGVERVRIADSLVTCAVAATFNGSNVNSTTATFAMFTTPTTLNLGGTNTQNMNIAQRAGSQTISIGTISTANSTYSFGSGGTLSGNAKAVNLGTGGAAGSTTTVEIGAALGNGEVNLRHDTTVFGLARATLGMEAVGTADNSGNFATGLGAGLTVSDTDQSPNSGGVVQFGIRVSDLSRSFAGIKGLLLDGTANTIGHLAFSTRALIADATLTERMRLVANGRLLLGSTVDNGTDLLQVNGSMAVGAATFSGAITTSNGNITTTTTTFNLVTTVATTVNIGGAATAMTLGATSGTMTLRNPTIVGSNATQAVFNTVATTVNAFGAATALNLGAATGTATINNATTAVKALTANTVKFPSTQVASADPNTLDDYEEGSWTPTLAGSTTAGTATYVAGANNRIGRYTKIGNQVTVHFTVAVSAFNGTGAYTITGLPFTAAANLLPVGAAVLANVTFPGTYVVSTVGAGETRVQFLSMSSAAGSAGLTITPGDAFNRVLAGSLTYEV